MLSIEEMEALQKAVTLVMESDEIMAKGYVGDDEFKSMNSAKDKLQTMIKRMPHIVL